MALVIQAKPMPVIQKGNGYSFNPDTFLKEYPRPHYHICTTAEELLSKVKYFTLDEFPGKKFITFDTETHPFFKSSHDIPPSVVRRWVGTGKQAVPQDYPFCISICDGTDCFTLFDSIENGFKELRKLAPLLEDPTIDKIAHNTKFDMHMLHNAGVKIKGHLHDTVVLCKLTEENRPSFKLMDCVKKAEGDVVFEYMVDKYKKLHSCSRYDQIPRLLLGHYANADVWNCMCVFKSNMPKLIRDELVDLYENECALIVALYEMERWGMMADKDYEDVLKTQLQQEVDEAESAVYKEAGTVFNTNSGKQLYNVLMKLKVNPSLIKFTEKGNPIMDKDALQELADKYHVSIVEKVLEFRKATKLLGTYAMGIYDQTDAMMGVHGSINQTEATTGRMSITKPALQTLPKKNKSIRKIFVPREGFHLYFMDLDQIEYRLYAHYAKIDHLLQQINDGYDVHAATAAMLKHMPMNKFDEAIKAGEEWASDARQKAKSTNFALIYGVGNERLSTTLSCTATEAADIRSEYFSQIPEARVFINTVHNVIRNRGYVRNFYGRRRRLSSNDSYKAPNALIQGCAADYIKFKLVDIYKFLKFHGYKTRMINIVHDEIVFELADDEEFLVPILRWLLSEFKTFRCNITAGVERGNMSWGQKEEVECGFEEPANFEYRTYDLYNGDVFDIGGATNGQEERPEQ